MFASRARSIVLVLIFSLTLVLGLIPAAAAAAQQPAKPSSMAATGDSITRAFNLCFFPFTDCPAQSWATGTNSTVNSHARRLKITSSAFSDAKSGAKMIDLETQAATVATRNVGYVTVLMGGNDVCTDSEGLMTTPDVYEAQFRNGMNKLKVASRPLVYVVSIPNVKMLWEILKDNASARSAWNSYNVCQSLLANPLSTDRADIDRRERVKQRNMELNQRLRKVCAEYSFCRFDGEAAFGTAFVPNDVSTRDYFHPSTAGQAKLASVSWAHGYWPSDLEGQMRETNATPTPSITPSCTGLTCTYSASSTEVGVSFSWHFGDGRTSDQSSFTHTYAAAATYTVTLHAIDPYGATASTSRTVTVSEGSSQPTTGTLSGAVGGADGALSGATVSIDGTEYSTTTAGDGSYTIAGVPAGQYTVTAAATGYVASTLPAEILVGTVTTLNFTLSAESGEEPPPAPTPMWVGDLDDASAAGKGQAWTAKVNIQVVADGGASVSGAIATGSWTDGSSSSCTIDVTGWCTVQISLNVRKSPSTTFTMQGVALDGFKYHSTLNVDPDADSDPPGTAITVSP